MSIQQASGQPGMRGRDVRPGDWQCQKCQNNNFANREVCNMCRWATCPPARQPTALRLKARHTALIDGFDGLEGLSLLLEGFERLHDS